MYKSLDSAKPTNLPEATRMADEVSCLPIYPALEIENINFIARLIRGA